MSESAPPDRVVAAMTEVLSTREDTLQFGTASERSGSMARLSAQDDLQGRGIEFQPY